jgi:hypothetical protein
LTAPRAPHILTIVEIMEAFGEDEKRAIAALGALAVPTDYAIRT